MVEKKAGKEGRAPVARWDPLAEMARWDPFRELERPWFGWRPFESRLGRFFEELGLEPRRLAGFVPPIDISEDEKQYLITAEVPGVSKDDLDVEVREGVLTIRGEKKSEQEEGKEPRRWVERTYGSFVRTLTLPPDANEERLEARFKDGVLTLTVPRREEAKPRTIAVKE